jgi:hypothetical protein
MAAKVDFADPCSPDRAKTGYGPQSRRAASTQETASTKSLLRFTLRNDRSVSTEPPHAGAGKAFIPAARRKRTGGLSITRQPVASISTARHDSSQRSRYSRPSDPPTRICTIRSGASKCALASMTFNADCKASELGAPPVASKKKRASHRRKPLLRIGQVSRWPLISRSAKARAEASQRVAGGPVSSGSLKPGTANRTFQHDRTGRPRLGRAGP